MICVDYVRYVTLLFWCVFTPVICLFLRVYFLGVFDDWLVVLYWLSGWCVLVWVVKYFCAFVWLFGCLVVLVSFLLLLSCIWFLYFTVWCLGLISVVLGWVCWIFVVCLLVGVVLCCWYLWIIVSVFDVFMFWATINLLWYFKLLVVFLVFVLCLFVNLVLFSCFDLSLNFFGCLFAICCLFVYVAFCLKFVMISDLLFELWFCWFFCVLVCLLILVFSLKFWVGLVFDLLFILYWL